MAGLNERNHKLRKALRISDKCSQENEQQLEEVTLGLDDVELGKIDLVTPVVDPEGGRGSMCPPLILILHP